MGADEPKIGESFIEDVIFLALPHFHQLEPRNFEPPRKQEVSNIIPWLRPQVKREAVRPQTFGQVIHHPPIIERNMQLERIAQQNDAAYFATRVEFFERAAYVMSGDHAGPVAIGKIFGSHSAFGSQPTLRLPEDAGRAMLGEMILDGLARSFRDVQQEVDRPGTAGFRFRPPLFGDGKASQGALHRRCLTRKPAAVAKARRGAGVQPHGAEKRSRRSPAGRSLVNQPQPRAVRPAHSNAAPDAPEGGGR